MKVIGLTGGIATGKSTVTALLQNSAPRWWMQMRLPEKSSNPGRKHGTKSSGPLGKLSSTAHLIFISLTPPSEELRYL